MHNEKVKIELRPYDALAILSFLRENFNDKNRSVPELAAIHESVDAYESQIMANCSMEMLQKAKLECDVNNITGRHPENGGR